MNPRKLYIGTIFDEWCRFGLLVYLIIGLRGRKCDYAYCSRLLLVSRKMIENVAEMHENSIISFSHRNTFRTAINIFVLFSKVCTEEKAKAFLWEEVMRRSQLGQIIPIPKTRLCFFDSEKW